MGKNGVAERVRDLGHVVGPKAREVREVTGAKAHELGEAIKPKVKDTRKKVGYWIAGEEPPKRRTGRAVAAVGIGAILAFFLDPSNGKSRRTTAKEWIVSRFQRARSTGGGLMALFLERAGRGGRASIGSVGAHGSDRVQGSRG